MDEPILVSLYKLVHGHLLQMAVEFLNVVLLIQDGHHVVLLVAGRVAGHMGGRAQIQGKIDDALRTVQVLLLQHRWIIGDQDVQSAIGTLTHRLQSITLRPTKSPMMTMASSLSMSASGSKYSTKASSLWSSRTFR